MQQVKDQRCLLVSPHDSAGALKFDPKCSGSDYMFDLNTNTLKHTYSNKCVSLNLNNGLYVSSLCNESKLTFQKVKSKSGISILLKHRETGQCAKIHENQLTNDLFTIWRKCQDGGFTVLSLSRRGKRSNFLYHIRFFVLYIFNVLLLILLQS